jgi:hypothetical protein
LPSSTREESIFLSGNPISSFLSGSGDSETNSTDSSDIPLSAFSGYLLGYKNISLSEKFIYKKNKEV